MNTNFEVIGLTQVGIEPKSTATEAAYEAIYTMNSNLSPFLKEKILLNV